jgi:hypothetical protein
MPAFYTKRCFTVRQGFHTEQTVHMPRKMFPETGLFGLVESAATGGWKAASNQLD